MEKQKITNDKKKHLEQLLRREREKSLERMVKVTKEAEAERRTRFWFGEIGVALRNIFKK